ncbi:MAG TPA: hypothetical protein VF371_05705, partial [Candidatus Limnocylindrales bacterium]
IRFEPPREVATVLKSPRARGPGAAPAEQLQMSSFCTRGRPLGELAASFIHGDDGVSPLVRIDSNDDHIPVFLFVGDGLGPVGGHT